MINMKYTLRFFKITRHFCDINIKSVAEQIQDRKEIPISAKNFAEIEEMINTVKRTECLFPSAPVSNPKPTSKKSYDNELNNRSQSVYG